MIRTMLISILLSVTSANAGEIVWRSPTSGTLTAVSDPVPPLEPEQPAFNLRYEPLQVVAGTSVVIKPVGDVTGYSFSLAETLPPGLTLDSVTGRIAGLAVVAGNYAVTIQASKDGLSADLVLSIIIS